MAPVRAQTNETIELELAAREFTLTLGWPASERAALAHGTRDLLT